MDRRVTWDLVCELAKAEPRGQLDAHLGKLSAFVVEAPRCKAKELGIAGASPEKEAGKYKNDKQ